MTIHDYKDELFIDLLAVLFIGLKLTGDITWSWGWVLTPILAKVLKAVLEVWYDWLLER